MKGFRVVKVFACEEENLELDPLLYGASGAFEELW